MKLISRIIGLVVALFVLTGCGDSRDDFNPTDPETIFNLYPSGYFVIGYNEAYNLSGFDNSFSTRAGLLSVETKPQTIFTTGEPAIPVLKTLDVTGIPASVFSTTSKTDYFSIDSSDRRQLGFINTLSGVTPPFFAVFSTAIPATAKIGDSGEIGTYIDGFGNENTKTWQLEDGGDGRARLVYISTMRDNFGFRLYRNIEEYLIEPDGDRVSISLQFFDAGLNQTLALSGDKI